MTTSGERYSMAELVRRSGVKPATIRHYIGMGLLPAPHRVAANRFLYDRRHEQALRMVRLLRERRQLPLAEIRRLLPRLARMSDGQAFRTEMWDTVVEAHLDRGRSPAARLLRAGVTAFNRHGFAEVRVDDVCRAADLAKGSFYRYYQSKEDLFFAAAAAAGTEVSRAFTHAADSRAAGRAGAEGGAVLGDREAGTLLAEALAPRLPLLLDLLALAAQRRPGHARVARSVFGDLRQVVGLRLDPGAGDSAGRRVVGQALLAGVGELLNDPEGVPGGDPGAERPGEAGGTGETRVR
ncbi:MAG: TetR family transcriptional regulator [Acidimicrobiales bacterium]